ncbi:MAG: DedA family protein [Gammaproteobacteria bacterium]|nr:DedA family protein [Gammaproteobacteria bacterium]MCP5137291.1 DedA family protein [Gammaproteobacteria bacterium]
MRLFSALYDKTMSWSRHPRAPWFLGGLSFAESSFFPIPPDVMLAPMSLAQPEKAWHFAFLTTVASVVGGVAGYFIGVFFFDLIEPLLHDAGYWDRYLHARAWFEEWGFWAIFIAGFSPIPYKVFTIAAGAMSMAFLPFVVASAIGRGTRFFLVAGLMRWGGASMEKKLREYIDRIGWVVVIGVILAYFLTRG